MSVSITKRRRKWGDGRKRKGRKQLNGSLSYTLDPSLQPSAFRCVALPVKMRIMITANMSGFLASTPGTFRAMCVRENSPMGLPISSSNVALQALATLEVPATKHTVRRN